MKIITIALLSALITVCQSADTTAPLAIASPQVGRYQIINTTYFTATPDATITRPMIVKIDTTTGRTWQFCSIMTTSNLVQGWEEITTLR